MNITAFVRPYVFSVLPSGSVLTSDTKESAGNIPSPPSFIQTSVVQIRSSLSRLPVQTLPFPFSSAPSSSSVHTVSPPSANSTIRLLTPSPSARSPLFLITTPSDRTQAVAEGSTIWQFRIKPWSEQVDELVRDELYSDALALLETIDEALLLDKVIILSYAPCSLTSVFTPLCRSKERSAYGHSMQFLNFGQEILMTPLIHSSNSTSTRLK
jgi:hypothetical protein